MPIKLPVKRLGQYHKDGLAYDSVTTILGIISKPALYTYYIKQTAQAIVENPDCISNEKEVVSAVFSRVKATATRGKLVHSLFEVLKAGNPIPDTIPTRYRGYAEGLKSWWDTVKPDVLSIEKEVYSKKYGYAGSCDLICRINGIVYLVDLKTSKAVYPEYPLQVEAYKQALKEMGVEIEKTAILLVKDDGSYIFSEVHGDFKAFLHAQALWQWQNNKGGN